MLPSTWRKCHRQDRKSNSEMGKRKELRRKMNTHRRKQGSINIKVNHRALIMKRRSTYNKPGTEEET